MKKIIIRNVTILLGIGIGILIGLSSLTRPELNSINAPKADFSAERAFEHIEAIAQNPHPPGSEEINRVQQYIILQLKELGLTPEILKANVVSGGTYSITATSVENIVAVIPGENSGKAILLDAHYDTRAMTPGASDCSSGIAILLETARAVLSGSPLKNDIIFLFTDNEEYGGGLGAKGFLENYPYVHDIGMVINLEGLGSTGPSILFETGSDSRYLVKKWGEITEYPVGQSWFETIYKLTPINTDLNRFKEHDIPGLNFANWANGTVYHSNQDTPKNIDVRSVQHTGDYTFSLTKHFGNEESSILPETKGDSIYFTLFGGLLVNYPTSWAIPISLLISLVFVLVVLLGLIKKRLKIVGIVKGLGINLIPVIVSTILTTGIWFAITSLDEGYQSMFTFRGMFYNTAFYMYSFVSLTLVISIATFVLFRKKIKKLEMSLGGSMLWVIFILATSIFLPGFSYLFTWPLLFSVLAIGVLLLIDPEKHKHSRTWIICLTGVIPGIVLFIPAIYIMYHFALSLMIAGPILFVAMLLTLFHPLICVFTEKRKWALPIIFTLISIVFLLIGSFTSGFNANKPRPNAVAYMQNEETEESLWFIAGRQTDTWTEQFVEEGIKPAISTVGELFPMELYSGFPVLKTTAPSLSLESPTIEVLEDSTEMGIRTVKLRLYSTRNASVVRFNIDSSTIVRSIEIFNTYFEFEKEGDRTWDLLYYAFPEAGIEVELKLEHNGPVRIQLSDQTWDLSPELIKTVKPAITPRPNSMMQMPNFDFGTVVAVTLTLP